MKAKARPSERRFAYEGLDRVIHERARLSVPTSLVTNPKGYINQARFVDQPKLAVGGP